MTLRQRQAHFWKRIALVILHADELGTPITILDWIRIEEQQRLLVAKKASKTMDSKHLLGLAVDFCFISDLLDDSTLNYRTEKYILIGEYAERIGLKWGGRFGDNPATEKIEGWDAGHLEEGIT